MHDFVWWSSLVSFLFLYPSTFNLLEVSRKFWWFSFNFFIHNIFNSFVFSYFVNFPMMKSLKQILWLISRTDLSYNLTYENETYNKLITLDCCCWETYDPSLGDWYYQNYSSSSVCGSADMVCRTHRYRDNLNPFNFCRYYFRFAIRISNCISCLILRSIRVFEFFWWMLAAKFFLRKKYHILWKFGDLLSFKYFLSFEDSFQLTMTSYFISIMRSFALFCKFSRSRTISIYTFWYEVKLMPLYYTLKIKLFLTLFCQHILELLSCVRQVLCFALIIFLLCGMVIED